MVLRVDYARWGQTPEDLRHLALSAPHARTRERALALFDITQHRCATQVAVRTGRRAHTVMDWVHAYNARGPDALTFRRTGGRRPPHMGSAPVNGFGLHEGQFGPCSTRKRSAWAGWAVKPRSLAAVRRRRRA